jgi:triosephosphate isomerase
MNGSHHSVAALVSGIATGARQLTGVEIVVCPPYPYIPQVREALSGVPVALGAQNLYEEQAGAFTGEVAGSMLADNGCRYVIVGHSERRSLLGETDSVIARKFIAAQENELTPILCVGETLDERQADRTLAVIGAQFGAVVDAVGIQAFRDAVVAYEPVWAIGTGETATPDQAQEVHAAIRAMAAERDAKIAADLRLLYGGSVKAANAASLFSMDDIDGGLIGGASLDAGEFLGICRAAAS